MVIWILLLVINTVVSIFLSMKRCPVSALTEEVWWDGSGEGWATDFKTYFSAARSRTRPAEHFIRFFPFWVKNVCLLDWTLGGVLNRDTLYDTIHDYLVQAHILETPLIPLGTNDAADLYFHKAI